MIKKSREDETLFDKGQGRLVEVRNEYSGTEYSNSPKELSATVTIFSICTNQYGSHMWLLSTSE